MIAIIDYDAGNTRSVMNLLKRLRVPFELTDDLNKIQNSDKVILPGVGHAAAAMNRLKQKELIDPILKISQPFLGICVGMQLMYSFSEEGDTPCLGILPEQVKAFRPSPRFKVPHMGWNTNELINEDEFLFTGVDHAETYFVHSYYAEISPDAIATCDYETKFASAVRKDNFYGVQFHPEKSGRIGELIMKNFLSL
ncbi:MAG: imidazole glycerol phosphate synthase subunit HisH [Saprospiraceae bacterium]|nr:imidazole glycerol phosphate synthase subunit HisH [Saprospiraceae bacterium]